MKQDYEVIERWFRRDGDKNINILVQSYGV